MTRTLLRFSLCLALFLALLLPAAYAYAGGGGTPLKLDLDPTAGFKGDTSGNHYEDGESCVNTICVRIRLISGGKTIAFDTKEGSGTGRFVTPTGTTSNCQLTSISCPVFGVGNVGQVQGLLEVYLRENRATFWFSASGENWRLDWVDVTISTLNGVTTVTSTTNPKLYLLNAKGTRSKQIFAGDYTISLILTAQPL